MGKDKLEQRIKTLTAQQDQLIADLNAVSGAIQECQYWLEQISQLTEEKPEVTE